MQRFLNMLHRKLKSQHGNFPPSGMCHLSSQLLQRYKQNALGIEAIYLLFKLSFLFDCSDIDCTELAHTFVCKQGNGEY